MIGTCCRCGIWGEVDLVPTVNGGQRIYCPACAPYANSAAPRTAVPREALTVARLSALWDSFRSGRITPEERRELEGVTLSLYNRSVETGNRDRASTALRVLQMIRGSRP